MSLKGKRYVVVGGTSGMGLALANLITAEGGHVTIAGRDAAKLDQARRSLGRPDLVTGRSLDMTDGKAVAAFWSEIDDRSLDGLVVTASSVVHGEFGSTDPQAIRGMFDSKFLGPYRVAQGALPKMVKGGSITFFSGVLSRRPGRRAAGLTAVNAAIEGLGRALALELGPDIRVNVVSPGMTRTPAYSGMDDDAREAMFEAVAKALPVGTVAEPDDIAQAAMFLIKNRFVTGHVLDIDGGHIIQGT